MRNNINPDPDAVNGSNTFNQVRSSKTANLVDKLDSFGNENMNQQILFENSAILDVECFHVKERA